MDCKGALTRCSSDAVKRRGRSAVLFVPGAAEQHVRAQQGGIVIFLKSAVLLGVLSLVACAHWQQTADAWNGRSLDELILSWGPPVSIYTASDGRKVASFRHSRLHGGSQLYCNVTVNTNISGVIVSSKVDGNVGGCNRFFAEKDPPR